MKNRFIKKISIYFVGTLSSYLINILLVPLYAYFVLSKDLGEYDYIISMASMVTPIVFLVIWESVLKYCINEEKQIIQKYISTTMVFAGISSCIFVLICLILTFLGVKRDTLLCVGLIVILDGLTTLWQFSARALSESKQYVVAGIVGSIVVVGCDLLYILFANLDYIGLLISHILSQVSIIFVLEKKIRLISKTKMKYVEKEILKKMISFSAPLVLNTVCLWFYTGGNKIIVRNFMGTSENGLYSFASKFSIIIYFCTTIVSMAIIEETYLFDTLEEYKIKIGKLITIISKAYFSMIALALPAIYLLYSIAFKNTEYYKSSDYVFLLLISALFTALSNSFGSSFQVTGNTKLIFLTTIAGALCSLGTSLVLVNKYRVWGVLIGAVIGPLVMMILRAIYAKKATGLAISWRQNIVIVIILIISSLILKKYNNIPTQILVLFAISMLLLLFYRNELRGLYRNIIRK